MDFERKSVFVILGLTFMVIFSLLNFNQLKYKAQISQVLKDIEVITTVDSAKSISTKNKYTYITET
ncbi:hypothetical protein QE109_01655 [Fusibacter bizertensis]|uniref:Uncharacterized protein n=1 Tax=Fusibacter bizertensis TaxID=1488331 RepID=A0ABT6N8T6_9FIRM|nr:hypothetical protein [Fusibacter bizertensis]MDH8676829.1 hypothetical protein [Fusibacter bizertensis]